MKIGIYGRSGHPVLAALAVGFREQGHNVGVRELSKHAGEVETFDVVIVSGMKDGAGVVRAYMAADIPAVVFDFGYLNRVNSKADFEFGHFQFSLGGLNQPPAFACPSDRFDALDMPVVEQGGNPDGYVLLCGQVPGDAAHGMDPQTLRTWLREQEQKYDTVLYRPHPRGGIALPGAKTDYSELADALAGARLVVTYNSNVGHDALLAGIPVVCAGPAAYSALAGEQLPTLADRRAYFFRVAYGQWTLEEMRSGACPTFLLEHLIPGSAPEESSHFDQAGSEPVPADGKQPATSASSTPIPRTRRGGRARTAA